MMKNYKGIDPYVISRVVYHARKWAPILRMEPEDVRQELMLHILERETHYNSAKANQHTFIDCILRSKVVNLLEAAKAAKRDRNLYEVSLDAMLDDGYDVADSYDKLEAIYAVVDLKLVSSKLSAPLVDLLEQLVEHSVKEIAELSGVSKTSIYRRTKNLRKVLRNHGAYCV